MLSAHVDAYYVPNRITMLGNICLGEVTSGNILAT